MNYFVSMIDPTVSNGCHFCGLMETMFHCFLDCRRLWELFLDFFPLMNYGLKLLLFLEEDTKKIVQQIGDF